MKLFLIILSAACAALAASFAASGDIRGNTENVEYIAVWQNNNKRMAIFDAGNFLVDDSAKNVVVCSFMQKVKYSAIALGGSELRFGEAFWEEMNEKFALPLLATNINVKSGKKLFEKIRSVEYKNGEKYAVVSVFDGNIKGISKEYEVEDPQTALARAIAQIPQDYRIILLAHCEPSLTDLLISQNPRIDFGVQGHIKNVPQPFRLSGTKTVLQFGEQGEKIAVLNKKGVVKWRVFVQKTVKLTPATETSIEIFSMSGCPYSKDAIRNYLQIPPDSNYSIKVSFAGNYDGQTHKLSPGLPDGSIQEEKIYLAVQDLFPERFRDFLFLVVASDSDGKKIAESVGLSAETFAKWDKEKGDKTLAENYEKSRMLNVTQCPAIFINNKAVKNSSKIIFIASKYETPNLPVDYVLKNTRGKIDTFFLDNPAAKEMLDNFDIERVPAIIRDGFVLNWEEIPDGEYHKRDFHKNELVVIADSATVLKLGGIFNGNVENLHLLANKDEDENILVWWENRCLTTTNKLEEAQKLIEFYIKKSEKL